MANSSVAKETSVNQLVYRDSIEAAIIFPFLIWEINENIDNKKNNYYRFFKYVIQYIIRVAF